MTPKIENSLRSIMVALGNGIEKLIGGAKKAKESVAAKQQSGGVQPIFSIESQLSLTKIKSLVNFAVENTITPSIQSFIDKAALEISDGPAKFTKTLHEKGASIAVSVDISQSAGVYASTPSASPFRQTTGHAYRQADGQVQRGRTASGTHSIRGEMKSLPFEDGFFDYFAADMATSMQGDIVKGVKELGRVSTLGAKGAVADFHPFGRFAKKGSVRLKSVEAVVRGIEDYYKIFRSAGFEIENIREAFFDEALRAQFESPEEKASFRQLKDTPFLIFLSVTKKGR